MAAPSRGKWAPAAISAFAAIFSFWPCAASGADAAGPKQNAVYATPLVVDLDESGSPSLLAGSRWKWGRHPSKKAEHYRLFDLDGTGPKEWEWVGPDDGLLVWLKELKGNPTSKDLFGGHTWSKMFNNGFEALFTLDANHDRVLNGEELAHIGIWQDANSDAVAQPGEIATLAERGITELKVTYSGRHSRAARRGGATCNGHKLYVWDWWSVQRPKPLPEGYRKTFFEHIRPFLHAIGFGSCRNPR